MIPSQWIVIGTDVLTIIFAVLGFVDHTFHTALLTNPITLSILAVLGSIGIHQTMTTPAAPTATTAAKSA